MAQLDVAQVTELIREHFPQAEGLGELVSIAPMASEMRLAVEEAHLRPGGTVSGPVMMGLADVAMYAAILGELGPVTMAVTSSLNISFLRKPKPSSAVIARVNLLKVGRRLAVGEVYITSEGDDDPVAHVVCTYAIP